MWKNIRKNSHKNSRLENKKLRIKKNKSEKIKWDQKFIPKKKKLNILSFDCAIKSLAICNATVNLNFHEDIKNALSAVEILKASNIIDVHLLEVHDLIPECDARGFPTEIYISALKKVIMDLDERIRIKPDIVLVEYQMPPNVNSRGISEQLIFHYTGKIPPFLVGPSIKNSIHFHSNINHEVFLDKYMKRYDANKAHTKTNLKYWATLNGKLHLINHIPAKNLDDAADAFMQILGWVKHKGLISIQRQN